MIPTAWSTAVSETAHKDVPAPVDNPMSNMVPPRTRCHVFSIYRTALDLDVYINWRYLVTLLPRQCPAVKCLAAFFRA